MRLFRELEPCCSRGDGDDDFTEEEEEEKEEEKETQKTGVDPEEDGELDGAGYSEF